MIVAVEFRDIGTARDLVAMAVGSGFRESEVTSVSGKGSEMVAIRCSIRREVSLGRGYGILVSEEYVRYLVEVANTKRRENWRRMERFLEKLKSSSWSDCDVGGVAMVEGRNGDECEAKSKRKRPRTIKTSEEVESQRMTHFAVERNRRKQMNEHLHVLRVIKLQSGNLVLSRQMFKQAGGSGSTAHLGNGFWVLSGLI
ncbi:hypothetical protein Droror1_Dr00027307 [Drosera rotundifolia]